MRSPRNRVDSADVDGKKYEEERVESKIKEELDRGALVVILYLLPIPFARRLLVFGSRVDADG